MLHFFCLQILSYNFWLKCIQVIELVKNYKLSKCEKFTEFRVSISSMAHYISAFQDTKTYCIIKIDSFKKLTLGVSLVLLYPLYYIEREAALYFCNQF